MQLSVDKKWHFKEYYINSQLFKIRKYIIETNLQEKNCSLILFSSHRSLGVCDKLRGAISEKELMEMRARLFLNLGLVFDNKQDFKNSAKFINQAIFISE